MQQVMKLGISAFDLEPRNLTWVLLKNEVKIIRRPDLNDHINIQTYPAGFEKVLAFRDFKSVDNQGDLLSTCSSCWGLMDIKAKQLVKFPPDILAIQLPVIPFLPRPRFKLKAFDGGELSLSYTVNRFDVDWNGHLNNTVLNKIILANIRDVGISKYQIQYKGEALMGETIEVFTKRLENQVSFKVVNRSTDRIVALARVEFWDCEI